MLSQWMEGIGIFCILLGLMCIGVYIGINIEKDGSTGIIENKVQSIVGNEELNSLNSLEPKMMVSYCRNKGEPLDKIFCVNDYVIGNYKYVKDQPLDDMDEIIKQGTNCLGWSNFYLHSFLGMKGVKYQSIRIDAPNGSKAHQFGIVNTEEEYCIVDQGYIHCHNW